MLETLKELIETKKAPILATSLKIYLQTVWYHVAFPLNHDIQDCGLSLRDGSCSELMTSFVRRMTLSFHVGDPKEICLGRPASTVISNER